MRTACRPPPLRNVFRGPVHQDRHGRGLGLDGERARLDAPRVQQVRDQATHVVGLPADDAEELHHLGLGRDRRGLKHGRGRALDGSERGAQFMTHHAEELRPLPLQLLERRQVLHGDDGRHDPSVLRTNRRHVDQRPDAPSVGHRQLDFRGAHRRRAAELPGQGKLVERDLPPVRVPARDHLEQLLRGVAGSAEALDDAPRLAVERDRMAGCGVEHRHADRRGLDQGLEVGPRPLHLAVRARVGDRRRRLRAEQHQDLLVLARERLRVVLVGQEEAAEMFAPVAHRGPLHRLRAPGVRGHAERAEVVLHVRHPERGGKVAEVPEEPFAVGPLVHLPALRGRKAGGDEVPGPSPPVDRRDHAGPGAGESPGALDHLLEHGGQVEARADAQDRRAQPRDALIGRTAPGTGRVWIVQCSTHCRRVRRSPLEAPTDRSGRVPPNRGGVEDSAFRARSH